MKRDQYCGSSLAEVANRDVDGVRDHHHRDGEEEDEDQADADEEGADAEEAAEEEEDEEGEDVPDFWLGVPVLLLEGTSPDRPPAGTEDLGSWPVRPAMGRGLCAGAPLSLRKGHLTVQMTRKRA